MIQLILLIVGVGYAMRRPKLSRMVESEYPQVPAEVFAEWRRLELLSTDLFLWATWGVFILTIAVGVLVGMSRPTEDTVMIFQGIAFVGFLLMLCIAAVPGSKAAKLKKQYGIKWPR